MQETSRRTAMIAGGALLGLAATEAPAAPALWSGEYWAQKGDVRLYMYRKRLGPPVRNDKKPVLFLVHGSSMSSRSTFDIAVPGAADYSMMNHFALLGYDVWTMDHEGYGRSSRTASNADIATGAADLLAATTVLARETARARFHFMGESSGGLRAALLAQNHPGLIDRLALSAFTCTGKGSATLADRAKQLDFYRTHNRRPRGRDMIRSIFTRDKAEVYDPGIGDAVADAELPLGEDVPTGTYLDMTANLPVVDPARITVPVLLARGEYDGIAAMPDLIDFFGRLPGGDNQFVVLPNAAHSLVFGRNRAQFWHALHAFLSMPPDAGLRA